MKPAAAMLLLSLLGLPALATNTRTFDATYTGTIRDLPAGVKKLNVWVPLPATRGAQTVSDVRIVSPWKFTRMREDEFGNEYAFATIQNPPSGDLVIRVTFTATRHEESMTSPSERAASAAEIERAMRADRLVSLSPRVRKLADEITAGRKTPMEKARAIYDYVVMTMKYDKTAPGWGDGDTERACDIRKGNCTDFHSLFLSLARAKGIPARFVIGFPMTAADGLVSGYHCWAEFYVRGKGWIPIDASEAAKSDDPGVREYLFGNLDPSRVQFTIGRDIKLQPRTSQPLNYFIYPHAEADGLTVGTRAITLEFRPTDSSARSAGSR